MSWVCLGLRLVNGGVGEMKGIFGVEREFWETKRSIVGGNTKSNSRVCPLTRGCVDSVVLSGALKVFSLFGLVGLVQKSSER